MGRHGRFKALEHWISHMDSKYACVALLKEHGEKHEKKTKKHHEKIAKIAVAYIMVT